jgi:DNA-binding transcriptional regulator YhcF (GntR family)
MNGWIKISRDITDWQHYQEPSVVMVFLDLLLHARYEDSWFKGVRVKRGENVNSIRTMAQRLGMSVNTVQSALKKLVASGEITRTPYKYGMKTTINNYDVFQSVSEGVSEGVSTGVSIGVSKNDTIKEDKNKEDNSSTSSARARLEEATIYNSLWLDQTAMALRHDNVFGLAVQCMDEWEVRQLSDDRWDADHLIHHMRKKLDISKREGKPTKQEAKENRRTELKGLSINDMISLQQNGNYQQQTGNNGVNRHA